MLSAPPEPVLTTLAADGHRRWLYPTLSRGRYWRARKLVAWGLIALFVLLPIVQIDGRPAVLFDLIAGEIDLFGLVLYPTDAALMMLALLGALLTVFLATALFGRVWCGWACPQTVYLEFVYRPIERWIEGREVDRRRRDAGPWTADKIWRKAAKLAVFTGISALLAHVFVSYVVGWERLLRWMTGAPTEHWGYFLLMLVVTGLMLFNFGYFREQLCTVACPYARIQSVLLDQDSMIVCYDPGRGEPRGRPSKKPAAANDLSLPVLQAPRSAQAVGDCIDCGACVRTCPTGIDIRDGLQMECINCTQCMDACDSVMSALDRPLGLIRYTSERELAGQPKRRLWRSRTVLYGAALVLLAGLLGALVARREHYPVGLTRSVGAPFTVLPTGEVANRVRFRMRNQTSRPTEVTVSVADPAGVRVQPVGPMPMAIPAGAMLPLEAWIVAPDSVFRGGAERPVAFRLTFADGGERLVPFTLLGPAPRTQPPLAPR